jgi:hypothetical protein
MKLNAYSLEKTYKETLSNIMLYYNSNRSPLVHDTQASKFNTEVESLTDIMGENIDVMIKNEKKLLKFWIKRMIY